jgi:phage gp46-like protein
VIAVRPNNERLEGDIAYAAGRIVDEGVDVETMAYQTLFLDAPALAGDLLPVGTPMRGYWGDRFEEEPTITGSRLWLLERATASEPNAQRAKTYAQEALQALVDAKHLRSFEVDAEARGEAIFVGAVLVSIVGERITIGPRKVN